ncbi:MAG: 3-deoxy-7-phosphoheptulonate synthase [Thermoleophilia bacterium]|nr:3-deoxy-7-phosphoheptulonate synthase [Thermoleophilia bacterium]
MMIVMKPDATEEQVRHVAERIGSVGARAHISQGEYVTIVGAIGDDSVIATLPLEAMPGVDKVLPILKPYKLVSRQLHPDDTVIDVNGRSLGGGVFALIAGPCSVESEEQYMRAARQAKAAGASMLRGGAYKPRTSPYSFQGMREDGLKIMAQAREETGLPLVTELMDPRDVEIVLRYADVIQIGTRNMQNFNLLSEVGKVERPILLKRGMSATVEELLMAAEYVLKEGNDKVILCERGIRTFETATRFTLDLSAIPVIKKSSHLPVVVDPSHATGKRDLVLPLSLASVAVGADGLIVETHPEPENALCDGSQSLPTDEFAAFAAEIVRYVKMAGKRMS